MLFPTSTLFALVAGSYLASGMPLGQEDGTLDLAPRQNSNPIPNTNLFPKGYSSRTCPADPDQLQLGPLDIDTPLKKRSPGTAITSVDLGSRAVDESALLDKRAINCLLVSSWSYASLEAQRATSKTVRLLAGVTYTFITIANQNLQGWQGSWKYEQDGPFNSPPQEFGSVSANIPLERDFTPDKDMLFHFKLIFDGAAAAIDGVIGITVKNPIQALLDHPDLKL